jgi:hypothetical protein
MASEPLLQHPRVRLHPAGRRARHHVPCTATAWQWHGTWSLAPAGTVSHASTGMAVWGSWRYR